MRDFFDARLDGYEEHQLTCIDSASEFYPFTAACLPRNADTNILDLGCGTGLELEHYFDSENHRDRSFTGNAGCPSRKISG